MVRQYFFNVRAVEKGTFRVLLCMDGIAESSNAKQIHADLHVRVEQILSERCFKKENYLIEVVALNNVE